MFITAICDALSCGDMTTTNGRDFILPPRNHASDSNEGFWTRLINTARADGNYITTDWETFLFVVVGKVCYTVKYDGFS